MAKRSCSDTVQLKARMKEPLRAKLEAAAKAKGISLNAEMVHRLEKSFWVSPPLRGLEQRIEALEDRFYKIDNPPESPWGDIPTRLLADGGIIVGNM